MRLWSTVVTQLHHPVFAVGRLNQPAFAALAAVAIDLFPHRGTNHFKVCRKAKSESISSGVSPRSGMMTPGFLAGGSCSQLLRFAGVFRKSEPAKVVLLMR